MRRRRRERKVIKRFNLGAQVDFTDYTDIPDALEKLIDDGRVVGVMTLYKLTTETPEKVQLGMMNAGFTIEQTFDLICILRRSMMERLGFIDMADKSLTEELQADAVRETSKQEVKP